MKRVFIIGEAGVNHNGSLKLAKKMIDVASWAKVDAVKFQTFVPEKVISKFTPKAEYQKRTTRKDESALDMARRLEFGVDEHKELIDYCKNKGIIFLSSPFDLESIDLLDRLKVKIFKIPSGEIINLPYLLKIGAMRKKIIMSTGMSSLREIGDALKMLYKAGTRKEDVTVLHCNTEYPTPMKDVNLLAMVRIRKAYKIDVGYSDHTLGIEVPIAAVALGATVIEKHFTLDRNMEGPDHKASLEPDELSKMVKAIKNIESALGDGVKKPSSSEMKNKLVARKSIVASKVIKKGELLTPGNITTKRPGNGISPMKWYKVIGSMAKMDYEQDEAIIL